MDEERAVGVAELARDLGALALNLATLLRYLAMLGVVSEDRDGFRLTDIGGLLRADAEGSMRALALMYGGPFYESFAGLDHTVRTGQVAFERRFGENHFDYFARYPELAGLFDRSMAAGSRMFDPLPVHPVLTAAAEGATVVDIAGGNGELLGRILSAHPRLHGVLLERPHTVETARRLLGAAGHTERCAFRAGDFADVPEGGDVYVLSRVLHDWDDDRCRRDPAPLRPCDVRHRRSARRRTCPARRRLGLAGHGLGSAHDVQRRRPRTERRPLRPAVRRRGPHPGGPVTAAPGRQRAARPQDRPGEHGIQAKESNSQSHAGRASAPARA